ncbi:MAG: GNAT family N-acetyltransferase [Fimbriimonas sp.]
MTAALTLRPQTPADYARICELRNYTLTEPLTPAICEVRVATWNPQGVWETWLACEGEQVHAYAHLLSLPHLPEDGYYAAISVDPDSRRRGIGSTLLQEIESEVIRRGGGDVVMPGRDDRPETIAYMESRGFKLQQHLIEGVLNTADIDEAGIHAHRQELEAKGYQFATFAELGDTPENRHRLYLLHNVGNRDTPGAELWGDMAYDLYETECFLTERYDPHGIMIAVHNGEWVGLSMVAKVKDNEFTTVFTATLREHRGKGLGLATKGLMVLYAKSQRAALVRAQNDVTNKPMLAINGKLGFKAQFGWKHMSKRVTEETRCKPNN